MKFTEEQKKEIRKFFSSEVSVDLFESDLDKLESLIFNNNSIPIEPLVMLPKPNLTCENCQLRQFCNINKAWIDGEYLYFEKDIDDFSCKHFEQA